MRVEIEKLYLLLEKQALIGILKVIGIQGLLVITIIYLHTLTHFQMVIEYLPKKRSLFIVFFSIQI